MGVITEGAYNCMGVTTEGAYNGLELQLRGLIIDGSYN